MNILLIEKNQDLGESIAESLRGDGHHVEWQCAQGQQRDSSQEEDFDLIIDCLESGDSSSAVKNALDSLPSWVRTSLQAARERIEAANQARVQAEQVAAHRSRMAANLSHELKTPIAAMMTTAQTMLSHERTSDKYKQALRLCERNTRSMSQLIRRMLDLARAGSDSWEPNLESIQVRAVLTATIDLHTPIAQDSGVEILLVCREEMQIETDMDLLLIMVNNLVGNAIRYTPRGKSVILRYTPPTAEHGGIISVADEGPGIRPEVLPHIFDAFYQDEEVRGHINDHCSNYGLGLALTAELAERLNIQIDVNSAPGEGAAFHLRMPPKA